jgi:outer membrane receptor protein involved in Fe transport
MNDDGRAPAGQGVRSDCCTNAEPSGWRLHLAWLLLLVSTSGAPAAFAAEPCAATPGAATSLTGLVRDLAAARVAGAEVTLEAGGRVLARALTDGAGRFELPVARPAPEPLALVVRAAGYAPATEPVYCATSGTPEEIVLTPAITSAPITVTATRSESAVTDTAATVFVLDSADLAATAAPTLDDALRQVPGFTLFRRTGSRTANPTTQGVSLRGVGASGASRGLVLVDGIPVNDPFGGWVYWSRLSRQAIDRVEVVEGGTSDLYGSAALGGVLQFVTRPLGATDDLDIEAGYGNEATPHGSLYAGGQRGGWGARLSAQGLQTDGYVPVAPDVAGPVDTLAGSSYGSVGLDVERRFATTGRAFVRGSVFGESRTNGTPLQTNDTDTDDLALGVDWSSPTLGAFTARGYGLSQVYNQSFSAVSADRTSENLTRTQRVPVHAGGLTLQWARWLGTRHTLILGADARKVRGTSDEIGYAGGAATSTVSAGGRQKLFGFFAEDAIRATARLRLNLSLRYDRWDHYDGHNFTTPLSNPANARNTLFPDRTEDSWSPRLSALFELKPRLALTASGYGSFRGPTLNELYRSFRVGNTLTLANEKLTAERLAGGEAGARWASADDHVALRGNFFYARIEDPVANVTLTQTPNLITRQRQNLGRTRTLGVELGTDLRPAKGLTLSAGYAFTDATVTDFPPSPDLVGNLLPQVPRHQLTFQGAFDRERWGRAAVQARVIGAQYDDDQNHFRLDGFFVLDLLVSRPLGRGFEAFAAVENLFDHRYPVGLTPIETIGPPLLVRGGLRLRVRSRHQGQPEM